MEKLQPQAVPSIAPLQPVLRPARRTFVKILSSGFLVAASTALSVYIHSSFLKTMVSEQVVGYLFTVAYALTFFAIQNYWRVIARFGNQNTLLGVVSLQMLCGILLASPIHPAVSIAAFVGMTMLTTINIINYDLWLEPFTRNEETGRVRGAFWTAVNLGFVASPLFTGALVSLYGFGPAYLASAVVLIPAWLIVFTGRNHDHAQVRYRQHQPILQLVRKIWRNKDMRGIFSISLMLYLFYAWMVIYTPLYLVRASMGWDEIGIMFTIMLLPFVLIEFPAGWLADHYLGETEMLTLGFALMGIAVLLMMKADTFLEFTLTLFLTRVGASLVEIMRESYFYKKVNAEDLDVINVFRNTASVGHLTAPILASALLLFGLDISDIFVVLGVLMIFCTGIPVTMEDTK